LKVWWSGVIVIAALPPVSCAAGRLEVIGPRNFTNSVSWTLFSLDVTAFLQSNLGKTLRLRFTTPNQMGPLNLAVDDAQLNVITVRVAAVLPHPTTFAAHHSLRLCDRLAPSFPPFSAFVLAVDKNSQTQSKFVSFLEPVTANTQTVRDMDRVNIRWHMSSYIHPATILDTGFPR
jgi:hypothetical protein